jgi:anthranilate synthase component 1
LYFSDTATDIEVEAVYNCRLEQAPDLVSLAAANPETYPYLLQSASSGQLGETSLLLRHQGAVLKLSGDLESTPDFLGRLKQAWQAEATPYDPQQRLPFIGGWFLFLGYELAAEIEPVLRLPAAPKPFPTAFAARCDGAVLIRHGENPVCELIAESPQLLEQMRSEVVAVEQFKTQALPGLDSLEADDPEKFTDGVRRIKDYLLDGDVFQVNLSRGWRGRFCAPLDPVQVYTKLCQSNPAPFGGMVRWGENTLLSSSPERLVEVRGDLVQTRPIAGTRPRGPDRESDEALSRELIGHPKERAEHIMLIDLERNDLGRVCETGSVEVSELMVIESYAHVHHIVSNVRGRLRQGACAVDAIRAVFPGGTITGCPKVRCMEIIAELEIQGRGFYSGSMGYLGRDGQMDLNILIRSMMMTGPEITFRTGAGIVADSDPEAELAETADKARGLLMALENADA